MSKTTFSFAKFSGIFIFTTALCAALSFGASEVLPKNYVAESLISEPLNQELGNYYALSSTYQLVSNGKEDNASSKVFMQFVEVATNPETAKAFFVNTDYYKYNSTDDKQFNENLLSKFIQGIKFESVGENKGKISLELANPKQAYELLGQYVDYVSNQAKQTLYQDLIVRWQTLFNQVNAAVQAKLGAQGNQSWEGKLQLMRSVQALDDKLQGYHYLQKASQATLVFPKQLETTAIGAGIGAVLGFILGLIFGRRKNSEK